MKSYFLLLSFIFLFMGCGSPSTPQHGFPLCDLKDNLTSGIINNDFHLFSKTFYFSSDDEKINLKHSFELQSAYSKLLNNLKVVFPGFSTNDFYKFMPSGHYLSFGAPSNNIEDFFYINEPNIGLALMYNTTLNDLVFFRVVEVKNGLYLLRPHNFFISSMESHNEEISNLNILNQNLSNGSYLTLEDFIYDLHKIFIPQNDWVTKSIAEREELAEQIEFIILSGYERVNNYRFFIVNCK